MPKMPEKSRILRLKVWGENACFTRPEMKVERVSYDVMTPSAARGILEAILWKPAILWRVTQIDVLKPIRWESVRRNEVGTVMSTDCATPKKGSGQTGMYIEDHRQQRAGLFLRDVAYTIHAYFELTDKAGPEDTIIKFQEMFYRRTEKGQCFNQPYLGCREFSAHFEPIAHDQPLPAPISTGRHELGWMLHDLDYGGEAPMPRFFRACLENGRLVIPPFDDKEVRS
ncbi:MAG: type I-C CRISPR-associated protein Cas5c [bacterium]